MRSIPAARSFFICSSGEARRNQSPLGGQSICGSGAGAAILTGVGDVLSLLQVEDPSAGGKGKRKARSAAGLSAAQKNVLRALSHDPQHLEEIMMKTGYGLGELSLILLSLEESGWVRPVSGGQYVKSS